MRLRKIFSLFSVCAVAALAGVAAASAVTGNGTPGGGDTPPDPSPQPGTAVVDVRAADPAGGPDWATRRYTSRSGDDCVELGRFDGTDFGTADGSGRVQPQEPGRGGPCGSVTAEPAIVAVNRFAASGSAPARTVLFGVAGRDVVAVRAASPGTGAERIPLGQARTFLLVREGLHDPESFPVDVELADGRVIAHRWR